MKKHLAVILALCLMLVAGAPPASAGQQTLAVETVIAPQYAQARDFSGGRAAVFNGRKWGYIDGQGKTAVEFLYDIAGDFSEGLAAVASVTKGEYGKTPDVETWYLIDTNGTVVAEAGVNRRYSAGQPRYISAVVNGTYVKTPGDAAKPMMESLRPGRPLLPVTRFTRGYAYSEGYAVVSTDAAGSFTLPAEIAKAEAAATPATRGDMLIDLNGAILWRPDWGMLLPPNRGLVPVHSRSTGLWGFADLATGEYVVSPRYEDFWYAFRDGAYEVFSDGVATLYRDAMYYAVDTAGTVLLSTKNQLGIHGEGLLPIALNGQYGYCDLRGTVVLAAQYKSARPFKNGVALAETAGGFYFIDKKGVRLNALPYADAGEVCGGLARVQVMGQYGYVKITGRLPDSLTDRPHQGWAQPEVDKAYAYGLLPPSMAALYQTGITRTEMAGLSLTLLERLAGKSAEELVLSQTGKTLDAWVRAYGFTDSADRAVVAAAALGIVNGVGGGRFLPHAAIIRQDAAAMLMRTARLAGLSPAVKTAAYADRQAIAAWAREAVDYVTSAQIMGGVGGNAFEPKGTYTREQAIATMKRIFEMIKP